MLENPVKTAISCFHLDRRHRLAGTEMTATRDGVRGKEKLAVPYQVPLELCGQHHH